MRSNDLIPWTIAGLGLAGLVTTAALALREVDREAAPPPAAPAPAERTPAEPSATAAAEAPASEAPDPEPPASAEPVTPRPAPPQDACGTATASPAEVLTLARQRAREEAQLERRRELARQVEYEGPAPLACSRLIVWEGGSARGRIEPGGLIYRDDQVVGRLSGDGHVVARDVLLGRVDPTGAITFDGAPVGRIDAEDDLWRRGEWVGRLRADGSIVWRGQLWGHVDGFTATPANRRAVVAYLLLFSGTFR